jgi:hypothetical protein
VTDSTAENSEDPVLLELFDLQVDPELYKNGNNQQPVPKEA